MASTARKRPDIPEKDALAGSEGSYEHRFEAAWPEVECRLLATMRRRGITREVVEDAVQTTAERAYARQVEFSTPGELFAWCSVTAWRATLKILRKDSRVELGGAPDRSGPDDIETLARQRMALQALTSVIEELAPDDLALLFGHAEASESADPRRDAHRRHRLRARLAKVVEGVLGVFPRIFRQLGQRVWRPGTSAVGVSLAGVVGGTFLGLWIIQPVPPRPAPAVVSLPTSGAPALGGTRPLAMTQSGSDPRSHGLNQQSAVGSRYARPALVAVGLVAAGEPVGGSVRRGKGDEPLVCTNVVPGPQPTCVAQPTDVRPAPLRPPSLGPMLP